MRLAHLLEHGEAELEARTAKALRGGAVGLVEGRLEDVGDAERQADRLHCAGHLIEQRFALDDTGAGDQEQSPVVADLGAGEPHALAAAGRCAAREARAARTKPAKSG